MKVNEVCKREFRVVLEVLEAYNRQLPNWTLKSRSRETIASACN